MKGIVTVKTRKWIYVIPFEQCSISYNEDPESIPSCGYSVDIEGEYGSHPVEYELEADKKHWKQIRMNLEEVADRALRGDGG